MPDSILYTAVATSTGGGRDGHVSTSDGALDLEVATPTELGGQGGGTNPEQLFASGYAACFHSALRVVAGQRKIAISGSQVTAEVGIGPEGDAFGLAVSLRIDLPGVEASVAQDLADAAHRVCPYSRATRGNVDVVVEVA